MNIRFPKQLHAQLKQYQINETTKRNKTVSLHTLILEAVKAASSK